MMKRVGEVLSTIFDERLMEKAGSYSAFFSCWKDLTAKNGITAAGDHSRIKSLDRGLVWIEVDHPGWKQILQTKESKLLSDFRYRFPEMDISGISIVLYRPGAARPQAHSETHPEDVNGESAAGTAVPERTEVTPATDDHAQDLGYDAIKDETLKKVLMKLEKSITEKESRPVKT